MCIIVDANSAHDLIQQTEDGLPVLSWLLNPRSKSGVVIGGKLTKELSKTKFLRTLVELDRAGRVHRVGDSALSEVEGQLSADNACKSNDIHVVALALVSRCEVVFTRDVKLHADLKTNSRSPHRVSIYQTAAHSHLLADCHCITRVSAG